MKTQLARFVLAAFVMVEFAGALAFGQTSAQTATGGQAKPGARAGKTAASAADEAAVRALAEQYEQAFNANDARKVAQVYTEDGVFVDVTGRVWQGRAEIEKEIAGENPAARPRISLTVDAVRLIKPDVALMRGTSVLSGGDIPPGAGRGHWAVVAVKSSGTWRVAAAHTAAHPPTEGRGR